MQAKFLIAFVVAVLTTLSVALAAADAATCPDDKKPKPPSVSV